MTDDELIALWQAEAEKPFTGWDFSYLQGRYHQAAPPWSYDAMVRALLPDAHAVIDLGTGGGEKLLTFKDALPPNTQATEGYAPNVPVARANLEPQGIRVTDYNIELEPRMPFDDASFDLVLDRHESFDGFEIARILQPQGVFLTQQVDGHDLDDMLALFGLEPQYTHVTLAVCGQEVNDAGLAIEHGEEWSGKMTFDDVSAFVYYLHAIPWSAPADFTVERYADLLLRLHHQRQALSFTMRRFIIQARKI